jgi:hypothetical protein
MAKAYLESQGVTVTSTQDQWGKITFSGIKDGQDFEQTFDNDMAQ